MGQGSFKKRTVSKWKSVLWSDESKFDILVGNHGRCVLRAKEEGDLPACYQCLVQKPASLMVWGCISAYGMDSLHVLEGTMNAERYIKILEQRILFIYLFSHLADAFIKSNLYSPPDYVSFRVDLVYFSRTMQNHILQLLQ